jgi:hypothetical protein
LRAPAPRRPRQRRRLTRHGVALGGRPAVERTVRVWDDTLAWPSHEELTETLRYELFDELVAPANRLGIPRSASLDVELEGDVGILGFRPVRGGEPYAMAAQPFRLTASYVEAGVARQRVVHGYVRVGQLSGTRRVDAIFEETMPRTYPTRAAFEKAFPRSSVDRRHPSEPAVVGPPTVTRFGWFWRRPDGTLQGFVNPFIPPLVTFPRVR